MENFSIENYLTLNIGDMLLVLVSTLILVFIARKYFWNNLQEYVGARKAHIENQIKEAENKHQQAESFKQDYEAKLQNAKGEAQDIVSIAKKKGDEVRESIIAKANEDAEKRMDKAMKDIELERAQSMENMKKEIVDVAMLAAEKIVAKELDVNQHSELINEFIVEVGEGKWKQ